MSMTASHTQFFDEEEREVISEIQSQVSYDEFQDTGRGSAEGSQSEQEVGKRALQAALARLGLDIAPAVATSTSAFFRGSAQPSLLAIPPSKDYIDELQKCCANPKSLMHHTSAGRALAAMQDADKFGLGQRLIQLSPLLFSSPEEVLRPNVRCPCPQCRITDDLLIQACKAVCMGRIGNSLSHLMLALSQSFQSSGSDTPTQDLSDATLKSIAFI